MAALASDVGRADEQARAVMSTHIESFIASAARALELEENDDQAIVVVSAVVGALTLSRVMTDPKRADAILRAVRDKLIEMKPETPAR